MPAVWRYFDYSATFLWAMTGAMLGARRRYDVMGMLILAFVTSTGGGLLRDGLFIQDGPPLVTRSAVYLELVLGATLLVVFFGRRVQQMKSFYQIVSLVDALGLGAYALVGMNRALAAKLSLSGVILVGLVNAAGGTVLRDILVLRVPDVLKPGVPNALVALFGCTLYILLAQVAHTSEFIASASTIVVVFALRAWVLWRGIETRPMPGWETPESIS